MAIRLIKVIAVVLAVMACGRAAMAQEYASFPGDLTEFDFIRTAGTQGDVSLIRAGRQYALKKGTDLGIGDIIKAGGNGVAVINYLTDGYIVMWPGSKIEIKYAGRTARRDKAFYYAQSSGKVFNKAGGSYFGASDVEVMLPGGTAMTKGAEFFTAVGGDGTVVAVRGGSVDFKTNAKGAAKTVASGRKLYSVGGGLQAAPMSADQGVEFLTAAQYIVMASRGEALRNPGSAYPLNTPVAEYKPYSSDKDSPYVSAPEYNNNDSELRSAQSDSMKKSNDITTSDKVMGGDLPYFPAERMGKARNPDRDYSKDAPEAIGAPIIPGDTTDSELWPELFPEDDGYLKDTEPDYPFPQEDAKPRPTPAQRKKAESLRRVAPPEINAVTPRDEKSPKADYKGAYAMCQNYDATQSEVDDCVARNIKPEKMPGAVEFPEPPPELNLPMSHEPKIPEYVSLPPVSELPPPTPSLAKPQLPTCRYSVLSDYSLTHNNEGVDLLNQDRFASALEMFEDALRINPESADIINNIGITYLRMGAPQKGEKYMKKALSAEPGRLDIHNNYGCVLFSQGKSLQACSEWDLVTRQDASYKDAAANKLSFCRQ